MIFSFFSFTLPVRGPALSIVLVFVFLIEPSDSFVCFALSRSFLAPSRHLGCLPVSPSPLERWRSAFFPPHFHLPPFITSISIYIVIDTRIVISRQSLSSRIVISLLQSDVLVGLLESVEHEFLLSFSSFFLSMVVHVGLYTPNHDSRTP